MTLNNAIEYAKKRFGGEKVSTYPITRDLSSTMSSQDRTVFFGKISGEMQFSTTETDNLAVTCDTIEIYKMTAEVHASYVGPDRWPFELDNVIFDTVTVTNTNTLIAAGFVGFMIKID